MLFYLACPYSHSDPAIRESRFQQANAYAAGLLREGIMVFSPISHTHPIAKDGDLPLGWDFWEAYDRTMLGACTGVIVLQLDGWEESKGVQAEIQIARKLGLPIKYMPPILEGLL